ncbi:MAG TPA: hypothetical protein VGA88_04425 [Burkholderiales bacterium]
MIDTAVYRGGDMLSSWLVAALRSLGLGLPALSSAALPVAAGVARDTDGGWDGATRPRGTGA